MVAPLFLPKHNQVAIGSPKVVQVRLVVDQKAFLVAPDAWVQTMTFKGSVPGPMIDVHQNDYVELTLVNPQKTHLCTILIFMLLLVLWVEARGVRILYFLLNPIPTSQSVGITDDETSKDHD